jgi:hypothetical protein
MSHDGNTHFYLSVQEAHEEIEEKERVAEEIENANPPDELPVQEDGGDEEDN